MTETKEVNICPQCKKEGKPPHTCPYAIDLMYDSDECTCCDDCETMCAHSV